MFLEPQRYGITPPWEISGPGHPHPWSSRTCKHLYSTKTKKAAVYSAPKGHSLARARSRRSLGGGCRQGSVALGPIWAGSPVEEGKGGVNRAVAWDPWAILASLQQPSLVPGCAWRSGLGWSPRTPSSADTSSSPSTPASETELTIAGRQTEGVRACVRALPSPSRFGSSGRSRLLSVWAGSSYLHSTVSSAFQN